MNPGLRINKLALSLDLSCPECSLTSAIISVGASIVSMRKLATILIDMFSSSVALLEYQQEVIQIFLILFNKFRIMMIIIVIRIFFKTLSPKYLPMCICKI